jgi:hypothetical protein
MSGLIVTGFLRKSFVLPILAGIILAIGLLLPITGAGIDSESVGLRKMGSHFLGLIPGLGGEFISQGQAIATDRGVYHECPDRLPNEPRPPVRQFSREMSF